MPAKTDGKLLMNLNYKSDLLKTPTPLNLALVWFVAYGGGMGMLWLAIKLSKFVSPIFLATVAGGLILAVGLWVWRAWYSREIDLFSLKGWEKVLVVCAILEVGNYVLEIPVIKGASIMGAAASLVWFMLFTGILEEVWWRGIWFAMWRGRPFISIVAGAALFASVHCLQHNFGGILVVFAMGLVLGVTRHRGASIGMLAVAHGVLFNWFNNTVLIWKSRQLIGRPSWDMLLSPLYCALAAGILFYRWAPVMVARKVTETA